ncbi:MAG: gluconeogenesis factor YvcK family protein [Eubacteriales bacterium]
METKSSVNKESIIGSKVVVIGGGTGNAVILRGLKKFTHYITAIVTVADDGGGSGVLREDLGMLPPGDIRSCILALADDESIMQELLNYRFKEGRLQGQCFGNLFIAAMNSISNNFVEAIKNVSEVMAVKGKVLPVTLEDITLTAQLANGDVINGESIIPEMVRKRKSKINSVSINPSSVCALPYCLDAIAEADIIILGPGSLYTSIIPNLLVDKVEEALSCSKAKKYYICNIMTQPGETDNYDLYDHVISIEQHLKFSNRIFDYIIANIGEVDDSTLRGYALEGSKLVKADLSRFPHGKYQLILDNYVDIKNDYIRHDAEKIAERILLNT